MPRLVRGRVPCSRTVASSAARSAVCGAGAPGSCCAERQLTQADRPGSTDQTTPWVTHMPPRTNGTPAGTQARFTQASIWSGESTDPEPGQVRQDVGVEPAGTEDEHVRVPQRPAQIGTAARQRAEGLEEREVAEVPLLYLGRQFQQRVPVLDEPAVVEHPDRGVDVTDRYPQRDGQLRDRTTALRQQPQQRLDAAVRVLD